jgi:hypothetical protein
MYLKINLPGVANFARKSDVHSLWLQPQYRGLGAADSLFDAVQVQIDRLGLETFIEGGAKLAPMYSPYGCLMAKLVVWDLPQDFRSADCRAMVAKLRNEPGIIMWRPPFGKFVKGKTEVP